MLPFSGSRFRSWTGVLRTDICLSVERLVWRCLDSSRIFFINFLTAHTAFLVETLGRRSPIPTQQQRHTQHLPSPHAMCTRLYTYRMYIIAARNAAITCWTIEYMYTAYHFIFLLQSVLGVCLFLRLPFFLIHINMYLYVLFWLPLVQVRVLSTLRRRRGSRL